MDHVCVLLSVSMANVLYQILERKPIIGCIVRSGYLTSILCLEDHTAALIKWNLRKLAYVQASIMGRSPLGFGSQFQRGPAMQEVFGKGCQEVLAL